MFKNISIIGPGLLGGSIAMAVREKNLSKQIHIWSRSETSRIKCSKQTWCDLAHDTLSDAVKESDLILLCVPVDKIIPVFSKIINELKPDAIVTDVGSVKASICKEANQIQMDKAVHFIGSHPMAGSEKQGMDNASAQLLQNASCILTPRKDCSKLALAKLEQFWEALGMKVSCLDAAQHDALVAKISHLPHVLASALCTSFDHLSSDDFKHAGGGLKDTTRIAGGSPEIWESILLHNANEILNAIDRFEREIKEFKRHIQNKDSAGIYQALKDGQSIRKKIEEAQQ